MAVDDSATTAEDTFVDIEVSANDTDVDNGNAALKVAAGSIDDVTGGTAVLQPDGRTVRFTPALNANNGNTAEFSFTYKAQRRHAHSANEAKVTIYGDGGQRRAGGGGRFGDDGGGHVRRHRGVGERHRCR